MMPTKLLNPRKTRKRSATAPGLFDDFGNDNNQDALVEAERELLEIADFAYAHTSLKPISKTLFFVSRCLFVLKGGGQAGAADELCDSYAAIRTSRGNAAPD